MNLTFNPSEVAEQISKGKPAQDCNYAYEQLLTGVESKYNKYMIVLIIGVMLYTAFRLYIFKFVDKICDQYNMKDSDRYETHETVRSVIEYTLFIIAGVCLIFYLIQNNLIPDWLLLASYM